MTAGEQQQRDELIDVRTAASIGACSVASIHRLRKRECGFPEPVKNFLHSLRFRRSEVEAFFGLRPPQESGS